MKEFLGVITIILTIIGHTPYIIDTVKGRTKPHLFTWVIWSIVVTVAFMVQITSGGGAGSWGTGVTALLVITIAILAIKKGTADITRLDKILFLGALLAIVLWYFTKNPTLSIILISIVDACAFSVTIRKTLKDPSSETMTTYGMNLLRHSLSILALAQFNMATVLYPAYLLFMNLIMTGIILRGKLKNKSGL